MLVISARDLYAGPVSVRFHSKGPQRAKANGETVAVAEILAAIKARR